MRAYIKALSYYLPEDVLTNYDISKVFPEWTAEKVAAKVGINSRHIAGVDETASDMAFKVSEKLIIENRINKSDIDFLLLCTQSPDYYLPSSSCVLQDRIGLRTNCGALDFNLGCSGFVYGLAIAKGLLFAGIARNVLLVTSETYSKFIHPNDKANRTIFGDASAAVLVSSDGFTEIGEFILGTDGSGFDQLIVKNGGLRNHFFSNETSFDQDGNIIAPDSLYMNGPEIFAFTIREVPALVNKTLALNKLSKEEIDLYIFHQANKFMMTHLQKTLKISDEKFYVYLEDVGNTVSSTIPIALKEAIHNGKIVKGSKVLLAGYGVGLSWGGVVLTF